MKRALTLGAFAAVALATAASFWIYRERVVDAHDAQPICVGGRCCCAAPGAARKATLMAASDRLTLDPAQFVGPVKQAYIIAGENPALLAQLHCYCGCDKMYGHRNLLDCYRGDHASKCEICIGEALMAAQLSEQGSPVDQIRDAIRRNYAGEN